MWKERAKSKEGVNKKNTSVKERKREESKIRIILLRYQNKKRY
jgi:hypothetical protein